MTVPPSRRAISVPLTSSTTSAQRDRTGSVLPQLSLPKLTVRLRFPSPASRGIPGFKRRLNGRQELANCQNPDRLETVSGDLVGPDLDDALFDVAARVQLCLLGGPNEDG